MADYLFRRSGTATAPWRTAQQGPPPDAAASPSLPVAPSWPDRAMGMLRAAAVACVALVSATPRDAGAAPIPAQAPDRTTAAPRAAADAYSSLVSATPRDGGTAPIAVQAPDVARAPGRATADAYDALASATPPDDGTPPIAAAAVDAVGIPRRATADAYSGLLSATPPDEVVAVNDRGDPCYPDLTPGPRRAPPSAYNALLSPPVVGPWTRVQGGGISSSAVTTLPFTLPGPVTAGDLIVVSGVCGVGKTMTVSDSQGNGYQVVASRTATTPVVYIWATQATASGSLTVTITPSSSVVVDLAVDQYNYAPRGILEAAGTATATGSSNAPSAGPIASSGTALDYALVGSGGVAQGTTTPGAGYAVRYTAQLVGAASWGVAVLDRVNDASGSASPSATFANSVSWTEIAAVFLPAPGVSTRIACTDRAPGPQRAAGPAYAGLVSATPLDAAAAADPLAAPEWPDLARGPLRASPSAYAGLVSPIPPDAADPADQAWPDRAPGPQRAASPAYVALASATPRDGGTPPIAASLPIQAIARPRAGWFATTAGTPPDQGIVLSSPPVAPSAPDRAAGPVRAAIDAYAGLVSATPRDGGTLPIPALLPVQAMGRPRAAWYATTAGTPPDQGIVLGLPPVAPSAPDRPAGPQRAAVASYAVLASATPPDGGTTPIPAALPTQAMARPRAAWYPAVTPTPPDQGVVLAPAPVAPAVPDRAPGPRRTAVNAYNALASASPRDAGIVPTPPPIAASAPDRAPGPRRAPADVYSLVATPPLPPPDVIVATTFRQSLHAQLLATPTLTALVGSSIYPGSLPRTHDLERDGPALTYAVFRFPTGFRRHPGHNLSGSDGTVQARVRFDVWSYQYSQSDEITVAIYQAFEGLFNATWGTTTVMSCIHANEVDMAEPDPVRRALIYQIISEYDVRYRIAVPVRP